MKCFRPIHRGEASGLDVAREMKQKRAGWSVLLAQPKVFWFHKLRKLSEEPKLLTIQGRRKTMESFSTL
jgi:hypothetical protein